MKKLKISRTGPELLQLIAAFLLGLSFWAQAFPDPDLGWHLLGGAWIIQHQQAPFLEFINSFHTVWHDYHWLAQIIWSHMFELLDYDGLRLLLGLIMATLALTLLRIVKLSHPEAKNFPLLMLTLVGLGLFLVDQIATIRPQMLSFLLIALVILRLLQAPQRLESAYIFLLTALTVNIHVNWIFIPMLWLIYRTIPYLTRTLSLSSTQAWCPLVFLFLAGFISPYGILPGTGHDHTPLMNYVLLMDYALIPPEIASYIGEMSALFATSGKAFALVLLSLVIVSRVMSWEKIKEQLAIFIAGTMGFVLLIDKVKMYGLFVLLALPLISFSFVEMRKSFQRHSQLSFSTTHNYTQACLFLLCLILLIYVPLQSPWIKQDSEKIWAPFPKAACEFIAEQKLPSLHQHNHTRVLTHFNFGGWCRWFMYQQDTNYDARVTIDGRTQYLPGAYVTKQARLYELGADWQKTLNQWKPDVLLVPITASLSQAIIGMPNQFKILYRDQNYLVAQPKL